MPSRTAHKVAMLNRSSVITDDDALALMHALQQHVSGDFAEVWNIDVKLTYVESEDTTSWKKQWNLLLLDTSDEANALGYHDLTPEGRALGKAFMKTTQSYGGNTDVTVCHELDEMLVDPYINDCSFDSARGIFVAKEVSDSVEADELGYEVQGRMMSNFVTPAFFDPTAASREDAVFDFKHTLTAPFELAEGGYEAVFVPNRGWTQYTKRAGGAKALDRPRVGSRRERRANRDKWEQSVP